jgi:excisionase family DNA binding protein
MTVAAAVRAGGDVEVAAGPGRQPRRGRRPAARWGRLSPSGPAAGPPIPALPHRCPVPPFAFSGPGRGGRRQGRAATEELAPAPTGTAGSLAADHAGPRLPARSQPRMPTAPRIRRGAMGSTADQTSVEHGDAHDEADALAAQGWLRTAQVAVLFRVHPRTVLRWADAGLLPYVVTLGGQRRFPQTGVEALLARRRGQVREEPGGLLRTGEAARRLRVTPRTVARWSRQGRLASVRTLGGHRRYPQAEVDRLLVQPGDGPPPGQVDDPHEGPASTAAAERLSPGRGQQHDPASAAVIAGQAAMHDKGRGWPSPAGRSGDRTFPGALIA